MATNDILLTPLDVPRMRKTFSGSSDERTPIAGPSRLTPAARIPLFSGHREKEDELEDTQNTPRMGLAASLTRDTASPGAFDSADAPTSNAARLRAVLARTRTSSEPQTAMHTRPPPSPGGDYDSDFDLPSTSVNPSFAQESLKELFSRFRINNGDTPITVRPRKRRSSLESVATLSPVKDKGKGRAKRKSLSDDELDKLEMSVELSGGRRSTAATFDMLRERLEQSSTVDAESQKAPASLRNMSDSDMSLDSDTATLELLESEPPDSPVTHSTPLRPFPGVNHMSMQLPSHMQSQSQLLEFDSEMRRLIDEDEEGDSIEVASSLAFPEHTPVTPGRPLSWTPSSKNTLVEKTIAKRTTAKRTSLTDIGFGSRGSPSHTPNTSSERERENGWNRPTPTAAKRLSAPNMSSHTPESARHSLTAAHLASHNFSQHRNLGRNGSMSNLSHVDSDKGSVRSFRSRTTSITSDVSVLRERERGWNQPNPKLRRVSSGQVPVGSSPASERIRTLSVPTPPGSPGYNFPRSPGTLSPHASPGLDRPFQQRRRTSSSLSFTSDSGSVGSRASVRTEEEEEVHERERNWNNPQPKWMHTRRPSEDGTTPEGSPSAPVRTRTSSLKTMKSPSFGNGIGLGTPKHAPVLRQALSSPNVLLASARQNNSHSSPARPFSFTSPSKPQPKTNGTSRLPRRTTPSRPSTLPSIASSPERISRQTSEETETEQAPTRPTTPVDSRPSSRIALLNGRNTPESRIPIMSFTSPQKSPSPRKDRNRESLMAFPEPSSPSSPSRRGHRRTTTEFSAAVGALRPGINDEYLRPVSPSPAPKAVVEKGKSRGIDLDGLRSSDEDDREDEGTPTRSPSKLLTASPKTSPERRLGVETDGGLPPSVSPPQTRLSPLSAPDSQPLSPPASPPKTPPSPPPPAATSILSTPPRSANSFLSRLNYGTPSPPKTGPPELPDLPRSDDETLDFLRTPQNPPKPPAANGTFNFSSMKTPRPPGAWGTPTSSVPSRLDEPFEPEAASTPPVKSGVASEETSGESYISADSGLMTPAASMSRAPGQTTIGQTPAPPGGWLATPGTDKRKSLLKVRFEISEPEVEADVSSVNGDVTPAGHEHTLGQTTLATPAFPGAMPKTPVPPPKMEVSADEMESVGSTLEHNTFDGHAKPAGPLPPLGRAADIVERQTPRRGGIRVLDAYGREDVKNGVKEEASEPEVREETRSMMRIVNAMGDVVEEEELKQEEDDMDITANTTLDISTDAPLSREDALRVIRSGVAELASTMDEPMPPARKPHVTDRRVGELLQQSAAARQARARLMQHVQVGADSLQRVEIEYARSNKRSRKSQRPHFPLWQLLIPFVLLQSVLLLYYQHRAHSQAEDIFKTTYYDPYYPSLHRYTVKPDPFRYSLATASFRPSLSLGGAFNSVRRDGWSIAVQEVHYNATVLLWDWQTATWERWGSQSTLPWPPN